MKRHRTRVLELGTWESVFSPILKRQNVGLGEVKWFDLSCGKGGNFSLRNAG